MSDYAGGVVGGSGNWTPAPDTSYYSPPQPGTTPYSPPSSGGTVQPQNSGGGTPGANFWMPPSWGPTGQTTSTPSGSFLPPTPAPAQPGFTPDPANQNPDAKAIIDQILSSYGLSSLGDWAWNQYIHGHPVSQIMLDMRQTPEYQARFPGMADLAKKGMAISETDYINLERSYTQVFRQAGLPAGFYDTPDDFASFISNNVSPSELQARAQVAQTIAYQSPPEVKDELQRLYGIGTGDLTAYWLDPNKSLPLLQQRFLAAQEAGASKMTGYGELDQTNAEHLASLGVNFADAMKGFNQLANEKQLFSALPGESFQGITQQDQLNAEFGGDANAQQMIEREAGARKAQFGGGGGYAAGAKGVSGLSSATT